MGSLVTLLKCKPAVWDLIMPESHVEGDIAAMFTEAASAQPMRPLADSLVKGAVEHAHTAICGVAWPPVPLTPCNLWRARSPGHTR